MAVHTIYLFLNSNVELLINFYYFQGFGIHCSNTTFKNLPKIFKSVSKNLDPKDRNFYIVELHGPSNGTDNTILENSFSDVTFFHFYGFNIKKIETNAFKKTAHALFDFLCTDKCSLVNEPPKYDLQNVFGQISGLETLEIKVNISELPSSAFNIHQLSKLRRLLIWSERNLTVKSGAFQNLQQQISITLAGTQLKFEKEAFKMSFGLSVDISSTNFTGKYRLIHH